MLVTIIEKKMFCRLTLVAVLFSLPALATMGQEQAQVGQFSVRWQNLPLGEAVDRLRNVTGANIFVDRRVDPGRRVDLTATNANVDEVLTSLARATGLGHSQLSRLHYLGPRNTAEGLPAVAAARRREAAALSPDLRNRLLGRRRLVWPRLTEPRGLIVQLLEQHGWKLSNPEVIPHDLWRAGEMPGIPLVDQLTVLLAGFDLTYQFHPQERSIVVVPATWQAADSPQPTRQTARRKASSARAPAKQVFTLRVENQPVGPVLEQLATRLGWKLEVDKAAIRAAGKSLDTLVSFEVQNASEEELLEALLAPAGLRATSAGDTLRIAPK